MREMLDRMAETSEKVSQTSWSDVQGVLKNVVGEVIVYKKGEIRYQVIIYWFCLLESKI